jgi:uncharacterized protein with HEPN domain
VSRSAADRREDILAAIQRCASYRPHLDADDEALAAMAYDAILRNLAVIGEAVKALPEAVTAGKPDVQWAAIAGLRNVVIHEYFRVRSDIVVDVVDNELAKLAATLAGTDLAG